MPIKFNGTINCTVDGQNPAVLVVPIPNVDDIETSVTAAVKAAAEAAKAPLQPQLDNLNAIIAAAGTSD